MSTTQTTATSDLAELAQSAELRNVGIEFEYPVARDPELAPATYGETSSSLRDRWGRGEDWTLASIPHTRSGYMGSDHTGAEITSDVLDLYSDEPIRWYKETIEQATEMGFPPAHCAQGATNFGMHLHLSDVPQEVADLLNDMTDEDWTRLFFCCSIMENSLDPWRHGGVVNYDSDVCFSRSGNEHGQDHYEWRLLEPVKPDHFELVLEFLRLAEMDGPDVAYNFAQELVFSCDERLTAVEQYNLYEERLDGWPDDSAFNDGSRRSSAVDEEAAEEVYEILS